MNVVVSVLVSIYLNNISIFYAVSRVLLYFKHDHVRGSVKKKRTGEAVCKKVTLEIK